MAITGDFWNLDNPAKPWGPFDPAAVILFPFDIADWLAEMGSTYADHTVTAPAPLEHINGKAYANGVIWVKLRLATGATYKLLTKYPFTVRLICADGQQDERTFWLKLVER